MYDTFKNADRVPREVGVSDSSVTPPVRPWSTSAILRLQRQAGNRAVARLIASHQGPGVAGSAILQRQADAGVIEGDASNISDAGETLPGGVATPPAVAAPSVESSNPDAGPSEPRPLTFLTMKQKNIHLFGEDKYGHWWTEMDGSESYGWWPKYPVGTIDTLLGTEGELNGQTSFGGTSTMDPHHGDTAEYEFHPILTSGKSDSSVRSEVRAFATTYSGSWRWTLGWGQNCRTFQRSMMTSIGLEEP